MDAAVRRLIEALHLAPCRCVLAVTGGGAQAAALLLNVPGASRTVLEVIVPYDERSLIEFLGRKPEQFCSVETSQALAARAYERARRLAPGQLVVGVGCTASLATDRPKQGEHRFHITIQTADMAATDSLTLIKGARDREAEEAVLDAVLLNALAYAFHLDDRLPLPLLPSEGLQVESSLYGDPLSAFFKGRFPALCAEPDGRLSPITERPKVLVPGSFNPLHAAHLGLAAVGEQIVGGPAAFELSVTNVDKPTLIQEEVRRRLARAEGRRSLWLTRAPTFAEKAELFPGVVFAVGADTAERIVQPRYYGDDEERMLQTLAAIRDRGCRFLVAGRSCGDGRFLTLDDIGMPAPVRDLFTAISPTDLQLDISSTALRHGAGSA